LITFAGNKFAFKEYVTLLDYIALASLDCKDVEGSFNSMIAKIINSSSIENIVNKLKTGYIYVKPRKNDLDNKKERV
jgi:hypothetical protein